MLFSLPLLGGIAPGSDLNLNCTSAVTVTFHLSCHLLRDKNKCYHNDMPFPTHIPFSECVLL